MMVAFFILFYDIVCFILFNRSFTAINGFFMIVIHRIAIAKIWSNWLNFIQGVSLLKVLSMHLDFRSDSTSLSLGGS